MTEPVDHRVASENGVATITLARPQAYNALTADLLESLLATFKTLERDASVRAIVLTGEGKAFCSGQALDDPRTLPPGQPVDLGDTVERRYGPLLLKILTFPLSILTLGLFLLVINAFVLLVASRLVPGFHVDSFGSAFVGAVLLALVHMLLGMGTRAERKPR